MNAFKVTLLLVLKEIVNKNKIIAFTIIKYKRKSFSKES